MIAGASESSGPTRNRQVLGTGASRFLSWMEGARSTSIFCARHQGTTTSFINALIFAAADTPPNATEDDKIPELQLTRAITKSNDLWILGEHRLACADARRPESFALLLSGLNADLVFVDPPYNVKIRGHVSGKGRTKHREFAQASGEKTSHNLQNFWKTPLVYSLRTRRTERFISCAPTGDTSTKCSLLAVASIANSKISPSGTKPMPAWARSTEANTK
jgi:hypothetical protein